MKRTAMNAATWVLEDDTSSGDKMDMSDHEDEIKEPGQSDCDSSADESSEEAHDAPGACKEHISKSTCQSTSVHPDAPYLDRSDQEEFESRRQYKHAPRVMESGLVLNYNPPSASYYDSGAEYSSDADVEEDMRNEYYPYSTMHLSGNVQDNARASSYMNTTSYVTPSFNRYMNIPHWIHQPNAYVGQYITPPISELPTPTMYMYPSAWNWQSIPHDSAYRHMA